LSSKCFMVVSIFDLSEFGLLFICIVVLAGTFRIIVILFDKFLDLRMYVEQITSLSQ
jgi:hypothetical protein